MLVNDNNLNFYLFFFLSSNYDDCVKDGLDINLYI
jgi:hypothetical protein